MARTEAASVFARSHSIKGLAQSIAKPAYRYLLTALLLLAPPALADGGQGSGARTDTKTSSLQPDFYYAHTLSAGVDTNPKRNTPAEGTGALQVNFKVGAEKKLPDVGLKFDTYLEWDVRRYNKLADWDQDNLRSKTTVTRYDPTNDQALEPFVSFSKKEFFNRGFSSWFLTRDELVVGVTKTFNFDAGFGLLPYSAKSSRGAIWSLEAELSAQRRRSVPKPDSTALSGEITGRWFPNNYFSVAVGIEVERRWFDSEIEDGILVYRRDVKIQPLLHIVWSPFDNPNAPTFGMKFKLERNFSNTDNSYERWQILPLVNISGKF